MSLSRGKPLVAGQFGLTRDDLPSFDPSDPARSCVDPRGWFEHPDRRFEIEIGSGKGTFLVQQAPLQPEINFLGIEWALEFYRYAADRIRRRELYNVRMLHADATEFLRFWCPDEVAAVIHLYFSDPWPKKRYHKRRVVQDASLRTFHRVLQSGGELRLVTDHDDLCVWYEEHAARHAELFDRVGFQSPQSAGDAEIVGSNFERKYRREGRPFHAMTLRKL